MYITLADLQNAIGHRELAELSRDPKSRIVNDEPEQSTIDAAIAMACDMADSYLSERYALPVPADNALKNACVNLARHYLFSRRMDVPDYVEKLRAQAIAWLKDVVKGDANILGAAPPNQGGAGDENGTGLNGTAGHVSRPRLFVISPKPTISDDMLKRY